MLFNFLFLKNNPKNYSTKVEIKIQKNLRNGIFIFFINVTLKNKVLKKK